MSEESRREPHPSELPGHDEASGHDEHGHDALPLGPIDIYAWGAGLLGVALGVVIALAFASATGMV